MFGTRTSKMVLREDDVDSKLETARTSEVVVDVVDGGHAVGPALFYFENNGRALCFRHCQADSNARTKVIMKRYLFKCIGATVPPARGPLGLPPPSRSANSLSLCTSRNTNTGPGHQASPFLFRILLSRAITFTAPFFPRQLSS